MRKPVTAKRAKAELQVGKEKFGQGEQSKSWDPAGLGQGLCSATSRGNTAFIKLSAEMGTQGLPGDTPSFWKNSH